jgi:hypothetical protein
MIKELFILALLISGMASAGNYTDTDLKEALSVGETIGAAKVMAAWTVSLYQHGDLSYIDYSSGIVLLNNMVNKYNQYVKAHWPNNTSMILPPI